MRLLDLFSGIGGFSLAAQWCWGDELEIVSFCEIDKFCQKVLKKHWPDVPIIEDVRELCQDFVQNAGDRKSHQGELIASPAIRSELLNGEKIILSNAEQATGNGVLKRKKKSSDITGISASVAENPLLNFSLLTTNSIMETKNAENISHRHGNSPTSEDIQLTINSYATTATMQKPSTENAHMRPNNEKVLEDSASSDGGGEGGNPFHERGRTRQGRRKSISENAQGNAYITKPNNKPTGFDGIDILTAGIPCQPASCAGKRRGKEDDRWLWEETFQIIRTVHPRWCILENVRGLLSLGNGVVFDNLLSELESYGYEVQAFIIPACAVGAPHRRDRVWIVAHAESQRDRHEFPCLGIARSKLYCERWQGMGSKSNNGNQDVADPSSGESGKQTESEGREDSCGGSKETMRFGCREWDEDLACTCGTGVICPKHQDVADTSRIQPRRKDERPLGERVGECGKSIATTDPNKLNGDGTGFHSSKVSQFTKAGISERWRSTQSRLGRMVDGISDWSHEPESVPRVAKGVKERVNRLKSLGNAIVPQIALQIFRTIKRIEDENL